MHLHCNLNFGPDFLLDRGQIRKNFLYKVCSPKYQLPFSCLHFYIHSSYFWRKTSLNLAGQRALNAARRFGRQSSALFRHMADEHRQAFSPRARLPAAYPRTGYSSNWSPSRCTLLESTRAAGKLHWPLRRRPVQATTRLVKSLRRSSTEPQQQAKATALLTQPALPRARVLAVPAARAFSLEPHAADLVTRCPCLAPSRRLFLYSPAIADPSPSLSCTAYSLHSRRARRATHSRPECLFKAVASLCPLFSSPSRARSPKL